MLFGWRFPQNYGLSLGIPIIQDYSVLMCFGVYILWVPPVLETTIIRLKDSGFVARIYAADKEALGGDRNSFH